MENGARAQGGRWGGGWRSLVGGWASVGADKTLAEAACYETPAALSELAP